MGWRHGEIWLDAELLWFREATSGSALSLELNAPSFFGLSPAALAAAIPSGLTESRRRRAELRRRRSARKTRVAALAIGPAVLLSLAGPRQGSGSRTGDVLQEDPLSATSRLGPSGLDAAETAVRPAGRTLETADRTPSSAAPRQGTRTRAEPFPRIHWRRATSHGLPYAGSLTAGTQLPLAGPDWVTWNPVADTVPNRPRRLYGHEHTIRTVVSVLSAYRAANPSAPRVVIGDLSFRAGGPMEQHRSHQNGLDVDVYYPRLDRRLRAPVRTAQIDRELAQDLLDRFVAAGAQKVFVGYSIGLDGPTGVVIPYPNHGNHMHVRFPRIQG